jgi:HD-GYP domain-containing protein (c-di-GMP phosphodiesterase class II)
MLRKIPVKDLHPGMRITFGPLHSIDFPLLYCSERMLETEEDIEAIRHMGYTEALVDLSRSDKKWMLLYGGSDEDVLLGILTDTPALEGLKPKVELSEEFLKATVIYDQTFNTARRVMKNFKAGGKADIAAGSRAVENIVGSVSRNGNALLALSKLRAKDDYTFSHCVNVATEVVIFARHLGYDESALQLIGTAGFFHDLGKMGVPDEVLNCPRRLTPEEFAVMRKHPVIGYEHLKTIPGLPELVLNGALEHHERINGDGYPSQKKEGEISAVGRILAVVDVYDALSSRRVYKDAMLPHTALGLIYGMRGQDFMTELVERFIQCIGIYPAGSLVKLNSGHLAVVAEVDPQLPLKPKILVTRDPKGKNLAPVLLDLKERDSLQISACITPEKYGIDALSVLEAHAGKNGA